MEVCTSMDKSQEVNDTSATAEILEIWKRCAEKLEHEDDCPFVQSVQRVAFCQTNFLQILNKNFYVFHFYQYKINC